MMNSNNGRDKPTTGHNKPTAGFTPTEQAMLAVLSDGMSHGKAELHACLPDELGSLDNVKVHVTNIRKKLRLKGEDILCTRVYMSEPIYRLVRVLASPYNPYR